MSDSISELIFQVEQDDRLRRDEYKKRDADQLQKYEEMFKRINLVKGYLSLYLLL